MRIAVKNLSNETLREIEVPDTVFGYPFKEHLVHLAVEAYRAGQRSGSHQAKTRAEVSGSGRKLWRQKGTGRARVGSIRSPLWRKGGVTHGPRPRSYEKGLSAAEKKNALKSALSRKLAEEGILVLDSLELESPKTGELARLLAGIGIEGRTLVVDRHDNQTLALAARNNPRLKTVDALAVQVYDVVDRPFVVFSEPALSRLVEVLSR